MMKKIITIICLSVFCALSNTAQERREKIRTLKIAYLTEQIQLSASEAEKFWPIYNEHDNKTNKFIRNKIREINREIKKAGSIDNLDEKKAKVLFDLTLYLEKKKYEENQKYISNLKKVLSVKKILKLQMAEREFGRNLMRKYKRKRLNSRD
jgi:Skp family chaperone for outer membrane proteins